MEKHTDNVDAEVEEFLNDFVFRDCRLGEHPKVRATACWIVRDHLVAGESAPRTFAPPGYEIEMDNSLAGHTLRTNQATVVQDIEYASAFRPPQRLAGSSLRSALAIPLTDAPRMYGTLNLFSTVPQFFSEVDVGRAQLLGAVLVYLRFRNLTVAGPASATLGLALKRVREELGLSQSQLAERLAQSRFALSQWERGRWPPSAQPLFRWCRSLGLLSPQNTTIVSVVDLTPDLLKVLRDDPGNLRQLSPAQFEHFIANRLDRMGYDVTLTGATSQRDGGIDLIAVPKIRTVGSFLIAGQIKHHMGDLKATRVDVDRLLAWKDSPFRLGLLITNTDFTRDARWVAEQTANRNFLRLRDFEDLKRWIEDNFSSEQEWREIPDFVQLAPGIVVKIPRSRLDSSLDIWPLSGVKRRKVWKQASKGQTER
jgi:transcriptional regulator with XRE-family HTH domain